MRRPGAGVHYQRTECRTTPNPASPRSIRRTPTAAIRSPAHRQPWTRRINAGDNDESAKIAGTVPRPKTSMTPAPAPAEPATAARAAAP